MRDGSPNSRTSRECERVVVHRLFVRLARDVPRVSTTPVSWLWKLWINCDSRRIFRELRFCARVHRSYICARDVAAAPQTGFRPVARAGVADAPLRPRPGSSTAVPRRRGYGQGATIGGVVSVVAIETTELRIKPEGDRPLGAGLKCRRSRATMSLTRPCGISVLVELGK
jgi:hypothetical protein